MATVPGSRSRCRPRIPRPGGKVDQQGPPEFLRSLDHQVEEDQEQRQDDEERADEEEPFMTRSVALRRKVIVPVTSDSPRGARDHLRQDSFGREIHDERHQHQEEADQDERRKLEAAASANSLAITAAMEYPAGTGRRRSRAGSR